MQIGCFRAYFELNQGHLSLSRNFGRVLWSYLSDNSGEIIRYIDDLYDGRRTMGADGDSPAPDGMGIYLYDPPI